MSRTLTELTTDANTAAWIPTEHYVDLVLDGVVCYGDLSQNGITALEYDMSAGHGDTVNVRTVTKRSHSCASQGAGGCLSVTSTTFGDEEIHVYQWGDYDKIADFTEWKTFGSVMQASANEMAKRMANCRDAAIWTSLCNATPNTTVTTSSAWSATRSVASVTCCEYQFDIYNAIIEARQHLMGDCYDPDTVIIHPYAAQYLYYKENGAYPPAREITPMLNFKDGYVQRLAGLRVIEARCAVADDSEPTASGDEVAFVIDSSRAIGEVFGKHPVFHQFYDGVCNSTELTLWMYWGHAILDASAIVTITS